MLHAVMNSALQSCQSLLSPSKAAMCVQPSELVPLDSPRLECPFSQFSLWDSCMPFEIQLLYPGNSAFPSVQLPPPTTCG